MPRASRHKLSLSQESVEKHMNEVYTALEYWRQMGVRHYNFVLKLIEELGGDVDDAGRLMLMSQLETSRNNSLKAFQEYMKEKSRLISTHISAVKIFGDLDIKTSKTKDTKESQSELSRTDQDSVEEIMKQLMEMKNYDPTKK